MALLVKEKCVKDYVKAANPDLRVSKEIMLVLDKMIRETLDKAIALPTNRKTLKDIAC